MRHPLFMPSLSLSWHPSHIIHPTTDNCSLFTAHFHSFKTVRDIAKTLNKLMPDDIQVTPLPHLLTPLTPPLTSLPPTLRLNSSLQLLTQPRISQHFHVSPGCE